MFSTPIDYSKWDHLVDSDDEPPPKRPLQQNRAMVPCISMKPSLFLIAPTLEKCMFAGAISGLLTIQELAIVSAAGITYFCFAISLRELPCWCTQHRRFHTMPILGKLFDPFNPIYIIESFYHFIFGDGEGQNQYHFDTVDAMTPEDNWKAFVDFRRWQWRNMELIRLTGGHFP